MFICTSNWAVFAVSTIQSLRSRTCRNCYCSPKPYAHPCCGTAEFTFYGWLALTKGDGGDYRDACTSVVLQHWEPMLKRPELQSTLISETSQKAILCNMPLAMLRETVRKECFLARPLVERELMYRQRVMYDEYMSLSNEALRKLRESGTSPFPETLAQVIAKRIEEAPPVHMSTAMVTPGGRVEGCTVSAAVPRPLCPRVAGSRETC